MPTHTHIKHTYLPTCLQWMIVTPAQVYYQTHSLLIYGPGLARLNGLNHMDGQNVKRLRVALLLLVGLTHASKGAKLVESHVENMTYK